MPGSEFDLPLSVAVIAIGTSANPIIQSTTPGLETNKRGYIKADENAAHLAQRRVRRRRHRDRQRDSDSGDGRRTPRRKVDSRLSDGWCLVTTDRITLLAISLRGAL